MANIYDTLNEIQHKVYKNFEYETDMDQYGVLEKWVMPSPTTSFKGDCEDFALACRKLCNDAGIQTRLVVCEVDGEGHCVLEANGWIFDCNEKDIITRDALQTKGYKFLYISGYKPGTDWHVITK